MGYYCRIEPPNRTGDWFPFHFIGNGYVYFLENGFWNSIDIKLSTIEDIGYKVTYIYEDEKEMMEDLERFEVVLELEK